MRATAASFLTALVVLVTHWSIASSVNVEVENGVYKLADTNFEAAIAKSPTMMIHFFTADCAACDSLKPLFEKAAKKVKKNLPNGPRLAKVDAVVEEGVAKKYGANPAATQPTLVVLKDGKSWKYEGDLEPDDIFKYMECVALPLPGDVARGYCAAQLVYKDALRKVLPGKLRKYLFKWFAFPLVILTPFLFILFCMCCCRGGKTKAPPKATNGKTTNGKAAKGKDSNGKATNGEKENAKAKKDSDEKKED